MMRGALTVCLCFVFYAPGMSAEKASSKPETPSNETAAKGLWSFAPLNDVVPPPAGLGWARTPVDQFIAAKHAENKLKAAREVSRVRLIRRASFDLLGLAPARRDVEDFVRDEQPGAFDRALDRLLSSPHYGERWGRHWLDVARFGESHGYEADNERPEAWTFRDAVIHALNEDLPFDEFVRWQLAGDQVGSKHHLAVPLTGFLTAGPTVTNVDAIDREKAKYDKMDDVVSTTASGFLGLTIGCARCHDHKFDPISTKDYYRLVGFFIGGNTRKQSLTLRSGHGSVNGLAWAGGSKKTPILKRGDVTQKGENVDPGAPHVLTEALSEFRSRADLANWMTDREKGAGALVARVIVNRLWQHHFGRGLVASSNNFGVIGDFPSHPRLLDWLAATLIAYDWNLKPLHRLIMSSAVYRQDTSDNGKDYGRDPENIYLARWTPRRLEAESIRDSILHAAGTLNTKIGGPSVKPWISRDAIETGSTKKWPVNVKDGPKTWRRAIYIFMRRSMRMPFLEVFDTPDAMSSRGKRVTTTVAPQALLLLNNRFVREHAEKFAAAISKEASDDKASVERAYWRALSRAPSSNELELSLEFIRSEGQSLANLCHALMTLNEFVYVD